MAWISFPNSVWGNTTPYFMALSPRQLVLRRSVQDLGALAGFQLAGVHCHRQHAVIADHPRELDESVIAEPCLERLERRVINPMLADELSRELHDLGVLRRDAARVFLSDGRDGGLRHAEP